MLKRGTLGAPTSPAAFPEDADGDVGAPRAAEQAAVHVGKAVGPAANVGRLALGEPGIHGAEQLGGHQVGVGGIARGHLLDRAGEETVAVEDGGVFDEEAEDQPGHEVVEILAAGVGGPFRVVLEQFDVEPVEAAGGLNIEGFFADRFDRSDTGQRQKEAEVIVEIRAGAGDRLAIGQILGLEALAIGGEGELGLLPRVRGALAEGGECGGHRALGADFQVEIVALKNTAGEVRLVRVATAQAAVRGLRIPEGFEEGVRKNRRVKGRGDEIGNGLFDLNGVRGGGSCGPSRKGGWVFEAARRPRAEPRRLLFEGLEFVIGFTVEHRPAGGGEFLAEGIGGGEILGLFCGPARGGEGGDGGGDIGFRCGGSGEVEAEREHRSIKQRRVYIAGFAMIDRREQCAQRGWRVEVVMECCDDRSVDIHQPGRVSHGGAKRAQGGQRALRRAQRIEHKVELLARVPHEQRITDGHR